MSTKSHAYTRCETLRKSSISTKEYVRIHIQRPFFDNKNSKNSWIENPNGRNMFYCFLYTYKFLFLRNTKISIFGGISKFRLWVDFGKFWQFWIEFVALTVAKSMPETRLKSSKPHNS
jgi:hypothetical protein